MSVIRYALSILFCNLYRLLRFIPNNDPIMGVMLPFARNETWWKASLFSFITMVSFDFVTGFLGVWTIVTSLSYALLGISAHFWFKKKIRATMTDYLAFGIWGVLFYDFITGPIMSSTLFGMSFADAFLARSHLRQCTWEA